MTTTLRRDLGLIAATSVVVGSMIGSGIFLGPEVAARSFATQGTVPGLLEILGVWAFGGIIVLLGALTYAELAAMFPRSGGQMVYIQEAYGPRLGFLNGWSIFLITKTGSITALAVAFAQIYSALVGVTGYESFVVAIGLITGLSLINAVGVRFGGWVQVVTTVGKLIALAALIVIGLMGAGDAVVPPLGPGATAPGDVDLQTGPATALSLFSGGFLALVAVLFAYDGWYNSTQIAEEIKDPERNLPKSLILGVSLVMGVYLLANLAYTAVLTGPGLAAIDASAGPLSSASAILARAVASETTARLLLVGVLVSIFGTTNAVILTGPRIILAMADEGYLPSKVGDIHPRWATPHWAILVQGIWAVAILFFSDSFDTLITWVISTTWLFLGLAGLGVFILRRKRPDVPRPYKVPLYPWVPGLFVLLAAVFLANVMFTRPIELLAGLALTATGLPIIWYAERKGWPEQARARVAARRVGDEATDEETIVR